MNRSRDKVRCALNHQNAGSIPVDFGSTAVTGIHCRIVEALRNYYGLAPRPVKIVDAFQMLGEIDAELAEKIGVDCIGIGGPKDIFDLDTTRMHEQTTPWGQRVLVPEAMDLTPDMPCLPQHSNKPDHSLSIARTLLHCLPSPNDLLQWAADAQ